MMKSNKKLPPLETQMGFILFFKERINCKLQTEKFYKRPEITKKLVYSKKL